MKVDTGANLQKNVDDNDLQTGTTPTQTKLTACNGAPIVRHGFCSINCSYGGKETNASC